VKVTGEPDDGKLSRPVRRGADGKVSSDNSPAAYPTIELTRRLVKAGEIMGIEILDHIIISSHDFLSLKERGLM
jgi:DNA repair protein RadC